MFSKDLFGILRVFLVSLCLGGSILFSPLSADATELSYKTLATLPIQQGGRVKPLDTFARESVRIITGHESFEGRSSMDLLMDWLANAKNWENKEFILMQNLELKSFLQIPVEQKWVTPEKLRNNEGFIAFARTCYNKQQKKITLNPEEKEALAVFERIQRFIDIESGDAWAIVPIPDSKTQGWASIGDLYRAYQRDMQKMPEAGKAVLDGTAALLKAYVAHDAASFDQASSNLESLLAQIGGKDYVDPFKIKIEVQFNALKPFLLAWIIHLLAALFIAASLLSRTPSMVNLFFRPGFGLFMIGIGMSLYGFVLRCIIAGRPPVSNMYESLIWVTFGMTLFALVFEFIFKTRTFALAGSILAVIGFVLADNVPTILDPAIQPIEPVLRSNFWLTIHVLTITLSYAAFLLSLGVGHVCLWSLWNHPKDKNRLQQQTKLLYRVVQVGVVLLAAGTILGGVWANYSWGRFWGWDPKETWALIALLGYIAILHGRLAGWLRELGFTIGVVSAFLGVLMAWYGVNFILGVGLHSYGFSKGGLPFVIAFVTVEISLLILVGLKARNVVAA